jgi:hypothetical protein
MSIEEVNDLIGNRTRGLRYRVPLCIFEVFPKIMPVLQTLRLESGSCNQFSFECSSLRFYEGGSHWMLLIF